MPGGRSGLYPGIEKKHQSAEYKQYEAENDLLRAVGRERLLELAQAERDGRLAVLPCKGGMRCLSMCGRSRITICTRLTDAEIMQSAKWCLL